MKYAVLFLALICTLSAYGGELVIPVVYRGGGANDTLWRTEISVTNVTRNAQFPTFVTVTLERENQEAVSIHTPLMPMEGLTIHDAIREWFGLDSAAGIVRITWTDAGRVTAWARIYNVHQSGEFGQFVPAFSLGDLPMDNYLTGLSGLNGNRTNVGVGNPWGEDARVWIELYDQAGESRGAVSVTIPARSFRQWNDIFRHFRVEPQHFAVVRVSGVTLPVYAYASVVRDDTGDANFVVPAR